MKVKVSASVWSSKSEPKFINLWMLKQKWKWVTNMSVKVKVTLNAHRPHCPSFNSVRLKVLLFHTFTFSLSHLHKGAPLPYPSLSSVELTCLLFHSFTLSLFLHSHLDMGASSPCLSLSSAGLKVVCWRNQLEAELDFSSIGRISEILIHFIDIWRNVSIFRIYQIIRI